MYQESAGRLFLKYAVPQMIGLLFNSVYIIVDGVFIGMRLGSTALAAAGVAVPVVELLIALSIGMTSGAGVAISERLAVKDFRAARSAFMNALFLQGCFGAAIVLPGNLFLHPLVTRLGATPDIHGLTATYLRYIVTLSPFLLFSHLLGGLARNDGRPKLAMTALSAGSLSNILLDYLFMYPLDMGIAGAALATAIGPVISVLILLPHFLFRKGYLYFRRERPDADTLKWFLILGAPSFVLEFSIGMVTFLMNYGIVRYGFGEEGLAAFAAGRSRLYFAGFFCAGLNILMISYFQSAQASGRALLLSSLRGLLLPGLLILTLPAAAGPSALWICHSAAECCTLLVCLLLPGRPAGG